MFAIRLGQRGGKVVGRVAEQDEKQATRRKGEHFGGLERGRRISGGSWRGIGCVGVNLWNDQPR